MTKIQYISQGNSVEEQLHNIRKVLDSGCTWVQLRYKNAPQTEVFFLASLVKRITDSYNCKLIINDNLQVAKLVDADGIHLGLSDMPIHEARAIFGPDKIYGGTANSLEDVLQRHNERCDYIGLGPYRFTTTKEKLSPILGLEGYRQILAQLKALQISIPIYAIGGIQLEDIAGILDTGVYGVALSGLITHHPDQKQLFNQLQQLCNPYI